MTEDTKSLIAFMATLGSICFLSKVGGTGSDLAIMTGLIGILGMLAQGFRKGEKKTEGTQDVTIVNPPDDPANVQDQTR